MFMTIIVFQIKKIILKMSSQDMFEEEKVNINEDEGTDNANLSSVPSSYVDIPLGQSTNENVPSPLYPTQDIACPSSSQDIPFVATPKKSTLSAGSSSEDVPSFSSDSSKLSYE
jgi:hypothetical protein